MYRCLTAKERSELRAQRVRALEITLFGHELEIDELTALMQHWPDDNSIKEALQQAHNAWKATKFRIEAIADTVDGDMEESDGEAN